MERANRTLDEALEEEELTDYLQAVKVIARLIRWYNEQRLHSALGFLRPVDYYRGKPEELYAQRRQKLIAARQRRRGTLPECRHCGPPDFRLSRGGIADSRPTPSRGPGQETAAACSGRCRCGFSAPRSQIGQQETRNPAWEAGSL